MNKKEIAIGIVRQLLWFALFFIVSFITSICAAVPLALVKYREVLLTLFYSIGDYDKFKSYLSAMLSDSSVVSFYNDIVILSEILTFVVFFCIYIVKNHMVLEKKRDDALPAGRIIHLISLGCLLNFIITFLISLIPMEFMEASGYMEATNFQGTTVFLIIAFGICAPVLEEIIFRDLMYKSLSNYKILSAIISSILFGVAHLNIIQGLYAFLLGIFFVYANEKYDTILPSSIMHLAINFVSLTIIWAENNDIMFELIALIVGFFIIAIFILDCVLNHKQIKCEGLMYFVRC